MDSGFTDFPQQILEAELAFFIAVGHEENAVLGELAGEAFEFVGVAWW